MSLLIKRVSVMKFPLCKIAEREVAETFGESEEIGSGAHGNIYLVQWQGKPAALKVCNDYSATKEINNTKLIRELKSKAPPEVASYLPEIYRANMVEHGGETYGIIIMELLEKLPKTKEDLFTRLYEKSAKEQHVFLKDPGFVSHIIHAKVDSIFKMLSDESKETLTTLAVKVFMEHIQVLVGEQQKSSLIQKLTESIQRYAAKAELEVSKIDVEQLVNNALVAMTTASYVPVSTTATVLPGEKGEELRKALKWLVENGITWDDLHDGNLLSRQNGQLVLIDFGTYAAEAEKGPELPKYAFSLFINHSLS